MAGPNSFEVHSLTAGKWRMESIYDEKEIAVASAEMLLAEPDVDQVRVAQEVRGSDGKRKYRIVFRRELGEEAPARKTKPQTAKPAPKAGARTSKGAQIAAKTAALPRRPPSPGAADIAAPPDPAAASTKKKKKRPRKKNPKLRKHLIVYGSLGLGLVLAAAIAIFVLRNVVGRI